MHEPPAREQRQYPVQAGPKHTRGIRLDHVMHSKLPPHLLDGVYRVPKMRRVRGERDGAHRPRRGAGDDGERVAGTATQDLRDGLEHPDLISGARTAARQYQPEQRLLRSIAHRTLVPAELSASITSSN